MGHRAGHQVEGFEAEGPLIPEGEGYQEVIAKSSMDYGKAIIFIEEIRYCQRTLIGEREILIGQGIRHVTPAMEESEKHKEKDYG